MADQNADLRAIEQIRALLADFDLNEKFSIINFVNEALNREEIAKIRSDTSLSELREKRQSLQEDWLERYGRMPRDLDGAPLVRGGPG